MTGKDAMARWAADETLAGKPWTVRGHEVWPVHVVNAVVAAVAGAKCGTTLPFPFEVADAAESRARQFAKRKGWVRYSGGRWVWA